jgi:hypothetical protein
MPMICSSVKRLRFIPWSSQWARAYFKMDYFNGARSLAQVISRQIKPNADPSLSPFSQPKEGFHACFTYSRAAAAASVPDTVSHRTGTGAQQGVP